MGNINKLVRSVLNLQVIADYGQELGFKAMDCCLTRAGADTINAGPHLDVAMKVVKGLVAGSKYTIFTERDNSSQICAHGT